MNKDIAFLQDDKTIYADGSVEYHNRPGGPEPDDDQVISGPTRYRGNYLKLRDLWARVVVRPASASMAEMVISMRGTQKQLDAVSINASGGMVEIRSKGQEGANFTFISSNSNFNFSSVSIGSINGVSVQSISRNTPPMQLLIDVPVACRILLDDVSPEVRIGDVQGRLEADLTGNCELSVDSVSGLELDLTGNSRVNIQRVTGNAELDVTGNAGVVLAGGSIDHLEIDLTGNGSVRVSAPARSANLEVTGNGSIDVARVETRPNLDVTGHGSIRVGNWR